MVNIILKWLYYCFPCCFVVEEESKREEIDIVRLQQEKEMKIIQDQVAISIRHREMGLRNFTAEETASRFNTRLKNNKSLPKKIKKKVINAIDDTNSIVFNQITDKKV